MVFLWLVINYMEQFLHIALGDSTRPARRFPSTSDVQAPGMVFVFGDLQALFVTSVLHCLGGLKPSEKYESIWMIIINIWENQSHVPKHQPVG